jgi:tyrosyl-tRNA synthetase
VGSDQWFNILSGIDLIRRTTGRQVFGLVSPLIQTSFGGKMGKTERGAVFSDDENYRSMSIRVAA